MTDAHPSGLCPSAMKGVSNVALSEAYTMSKRPKVVTATPIAGPLIRATRGLGWSMKALTNRLQWFEDVDKC